MLQADFGLPKTETITMTKQLHSFIQGARQVLILETEVEYRLPRRGDFAEDIWHLRGDAERISGQFRSNTKKHGKQNQK